MTPPDQRSESWRLNYWRLVIRRNVIEWLELERSAGELTPGLAQVLELLYGDRDADGLVDARRLLP